MTAIESALLDLLGPAPRRAGGGAARRRPAARRGARCSATCSTSATAARPTCPIASEPDADDDWLRLRHEEALTPRSRRAAGRSGAGALRLQRLQAQGRRAARRGRRSRRSTALHERFPGRARHARPERRAGSLEDAIRLCRDMHGVLAYAEDPCGAEDGYSGREVMAEFRRATGLPTATNMVATDWRQLAPRARSCSRSTSRWPTRTSGPWQGSVRVAQTLPRLGPDLGLALQQPLRHLAGDVHARRRRGARARSPRSTRTGSGRTASA